MASWLNDFHFGWRLLRRNPGFTVVAVLTLALGIGANTTIFSLLNVLMFHPIPFAQPDRLVRIYRTAPESKQWPHSVPDFLDYQQQNSVFERLAAYQNISVNLSEGDTPERLECLQVTRGFFNLLALQPELGRDFLPNETVLGNNRVMILSHGFWQRRFGGQSNVIGQALRINGETCIVAGVMPASAECRLLWNRIDVWMPLTFTPEQQAKRGDHFLNVIARLQPGTTLPQAQVEMASIAGRLAQQYPESNAHESVALVPLPSTVMGKEGRVLSWFLFAAASLALFIACANLANLQLARSLGRQREVAIRNALGAGAFRVIRQFLAENLLLASLGGSVGLFLAGAGNQALGAAIQLGDQAGLPLMIDSRVLAYTVLLTGLTGLLTGIIPAWHVSRLQANSVLKESGRAAHGGRSSQRVRNILVVGQMAIALVLLITSSLFIHSLYRIGNMNPGFKMDHLLTMQLALPESKYQSGDQRALFFRQALERLHAIPGVTSAAIATALPVWGSGGREFYAQGRPLPAPGQFPQAGYEMVSPGFFKTLGIPLLAGRDFMPGEDANVPLVCIINETMARRFWPGESPLGKRISMSDPKAPQWQTIIGIVGDVRMTGNPLNRIIMPRIYEPLYRNPWATAAIVLRTAVEPNSLGQAVRRTMATLDSDQPVFAVLSFRSILAQIGANFRIAGFLILGFSILGLVLAAIGIYGVISYAVTQRTGEIGVRLALGAQPRDVLRLILRQGVLLTGCGIALGLAGALVLSHGLTSLLYEVKPTDPFTFLSIPLLLSIVAIVASYFSARRATKIEPVTALRCE